MRSYASVTAVFLASVWSYAPVAAAPYISEALPNTEDDAILEYFSVSNASCDPVSFSWYSVADASWKTYRFPGGLLFEPFSALNFFRTETKITLNNENETLTLFDPSGNAVDTFSYATTTKGVRIIREPVSVPACVPESWGDENAMPDWSEVESGMPSENETESAGGSESNGDGENVETADESVIPAFSWSVSDPPKETVPPRETETESASGAVSFSGGSVVPVSVTGSGQSEISDPSPSVRTSAWSSASAWSSVPPPASDSRASPESFTLFDNDADGAFDYVEIRYSENLSWIADASDYYLYSATGGLYEQKVATSTGYFDWAEYSWPFLRLSFTGRTLQKTSMRIDASTSSAFRIKSVSVPKLRTQASWIPVFPLWLTTSFSGYSADRISFNPPFVSSDEPVGTESETVVDDGSGETVPEADAESSEQSVSATGSQPLIETVGGAVSESASGTLKKSVSKTGKNANIPVPEGLEIIPSSWIDRFADGKYRYVCYSSTCPVSFRVEGIPKGGKGHWALSGGRTRFWTSTATLGKKNPAEYSLEYVLRTDSWEARIPIRLSVVREESGQTFSQTASKIGKSLAANAEKMADSSTWSSSVKKKSVAKASGEQSVSEAKSASNGDGTNFVRTVSLGIATLFLGLSAGAWFAWYFRSGRSE